MGGETNLTIGGICVDDLRATWAVFSESCSEYFLEYSEIASKYVFGALLEVYNKRWLKFG